jgi:hypothetical protein
LPPTKGKYQTASAASEADDLNRSYQRQPNNFFNVKMEDLLTKLSEVSNALTLLSLIAAILAIGASWWFFYVPRKIGVKACATLPFFWLDHATLPFTVHVTNINTRQFKINKVGFQTFGRYTHRRKSCSYELTLDASLLNTDKLLLTEGDSTKVSFDGYKIANDIARNLHGSNLRLISPELKIWLYLTHGIRVPVEADPQLSSKIIACINETPSVVNL